MRRVLYSQETLQKFLEDTLNYGLLHCNRPHTQEILYVSLNPKPQTLNLKSQPASSAGIKDSGFRFGFLEEALDKRGREINLINPCFLGNLKKRSTQRPCVPKNSLCLTTL